MSWMGILLETSCKHAKNCSGYNRNNYECNRNGGLNCGIRKQLLHEGDLL